MGARMCFSDFYTNSMCMWIEKDTSSQNKVSVLF